MTDLLAPRRARAFEVSPAAVEEPRVSLPDIAEAGPQSRLLWVLPLALVLVVQLLLSVRQHNTAFQDEALYLYVGHLDLLTWLHGATFHDFSLSWYAGWFSGDPYLYPPLAAIASSLGGLEAARDLSLAFMLGSTVCVFGCGRRLFGILPGLLGAALFGFSAPTLFLGNFATFDAPTIFLLSLAAWITCVAADVDTYAMWGLTIAAGLIAGLGGLTKYVGILFFPTLAVLTVMSTVSRSGWRRALVRGAVFVTTAASALLMSVALEPNIVKGFTATTATRSVMGAARATTVVGVDTVVGRSLWYIGGVVVLGLLGCVTLRLRRAPISTQLLGVALFGTGLLVTVGQAWLHTTVSLFKQDGYGLVFVAVVAGEGLAQLVRWWRGRAVVPVLGVVALLLSFAGNTFQTDMGWPNETSIINYAGTMVHPGKQVYLADLDQIFEYYLQDHTSVSQWVSTDNFTYYDPNLHRSLTGLDAYRGAIGNSYFSLIVLGSKGPNPALDRDLVHAIHESGHYKLVTEMLGNPGSTERWTVFQVVPPSTGT
ncbi:MAG: ArnT family glycosyltransferase [Acidimicrobiales bacterium]